MTRVSPLFYIETALGLMFDILIFNIKFSVMQIAGLAIIITSFLVIMVAAYLADGLAAADGRQSSSFVTTQSSHLGSSLSTLRGGAIG